MEKHKEFIPPILLFLFLKFLMNLCSLLYSHLHFLITCSNLHLQFLQAAKETGALQEAKAKLEKQVEELARSLQLERRLRVIYHNYI